MKYGNFLFMVPRTRRETSCQRGGRWKSTFDWFILIPPMTIGVLADKRLVESYLRIILKEVPHGFVG